jgi:hypothetical protein
MTIGFIEPPVSYLPHSSPLKKANYHNNNGNHQYDVNESSQGVAGHQPQQPQNYQYYSDRP